MKFTCAHCLNITFVHFTLSLHLLRPCSDPRLSHFVYLYVFKRHNSVTELNVAEMFSAYNSIGQGENSSSSHADQAHAPENHIVYGIQQDISRSCGRIDEFVRVDNCLE